MKLKNAINTTPPCPYCAKQDFCKHFLGWTENGRTINLRRGGATEPLLPTDKTLNTGVSTRVYRD